MEGGGIKGLEEEGWRGEGRLEKREEEGGMEEGERDGGEGGREGRRPAGGSEEGKNGWKEGGSQEEESITSFSLTLTTCIPLIR